MKDYPKESQQSNVVAEVKAVLPNFDLKALEKTLPAAAIIADWSRASV